MLNDQNALALSYDNIRLIEYDLHQTRIFIDLKRELFRAFTHLHSIEVDVAVFGF